MSTVNEVAENVKEFSKPDNINKAADDLLFRRKIADQLVNPQYEAKPEQNFKTQLMLEQYKLLIDGANKTEERRGTSNNVFLGINGFIGTFFVIRPDQLINMQMNHLPATILFALVGLFVSWAWLKVSVSYKKINSTNYVLIKAFEKFLPTYVFSVKGMVEGKRENENAGSEGNIVLNKENLLPKAFIFLYLVYLFYIFYYFLNGLI